MFKIGDFSKLAQVSVKTLRYYAQLGLLQPAWIDRFTGYRYYALGQLPRLNRILALKDLGFSLEQIQQLLHEDLSADELRGMLRIKQSELERQLQEEQARLRRVQARLRQIDQEGALPAYDVLLKRIPAQRVAGLRNLVADIYQVSNLFHELGRLLQAQGVRPEAAQPPLAIFYDEAEYREQSLDVEAALPLIARLPRMERLVQHELPPVASMACVVHQGSLEDLPAATRSLMAWVEANGYQVTGPSRTVYLQSDLLGQVAQPLVAEVQYPVQKKPTPIFISQQKENEMMEPKIVSKPAFTAVGMVYKGKNENNEIAQLWQEFNPRFGELKNIVDGAFGLCEMSDESGVFRYLAAFAVADPSEVPPGMEVWKVPAQKYAVFTCTLPTIREAYRYAFETWLPQSGYEYARGYDFEYYDENFDQHDPEHSPFSIYIPIK